MLEAALGIRAVAVFEEVCRRERRIMVGLLALAHDRACEAELARAIDAALPTSRPWPEGPMQVGFRPLARFRAACGREQPKRYLARKTHQRAAAEPVWGICARLSHPYMTRSLPRLFHDVHHRGF